MAPLESPHHRQPVPRTEQFSFLESYSSEVFRLGSIDGHLRLPDARVLSVYNFSMHGLFRYVLLLPFFFILL